MRQVQLRDWWPVARDAGGAPRGAGPTAWPRPLPAHAGLWLDRFLAGPKSGPSPEDKEPWPARRQLYRATACALAPGRDAANDPPALRSYRLIFRRWQATVSRPAPGLIRRTVEVEATSRLLLHAASHDTVTEGSVLLHHTYGVPFLPGAALRGVVRARLRARQRQLAGSADSEEGRRLGAVIEELFGVVREGRDPDSRASWVDFLDALWIPEAPASRMPGWSPLALDIVNPHHPRYYTAGTGAQALPAPSDEPVPVSRLTVTPGTRFLIVLEAAAVARLEPWIDWVLKILLETLEADGIGGWTSAGYGRLRPVDAAVRERSSGPSERAVPEAPAPPVGWQAATVSREPGTGELTARLADGRTAEASGAEAPELLAALSEATRQQLLAKRRKRRPVAMEVRVAPLGRRWRIEALRDV